MTPRIPNLHCRPYPTVGQAETALAVPVSGDAFQTEEGFDFQSEDGTPVQIE